MIRATVLRRKPMRVLFMAGYFSIILFLASFLNGSFENYASGANELHIEKTFYLPLREISGLYARPLKDASFEVMAVGDKYAQVLRTRFDLAQKFLADSEIVDYSELLLNHFAICLSERIPSCRKLKRDLTSQWEAIASDGSRRTYLMHEQFASIVVINSERKEIEGVINLENFDLTKKQRTDALELKENALGEGMILLRNGHIIVAKERDKASLIEFAPEADPAEGYDPKLVLQGKSVFPFDPTRTSYVPKHFWKLPVDFRPCDLSEVSTDAEGNLYILSQKCRLIAQVSELSLDQKTMTFTNTWGLPKNISGAEAFVVLPGQRFLVAEDKKSEKAPNLHLLSP